MLTKQALSVLKMLNALTGSTDKHVTYVWGKSQFCLYENEDMTCDFSEFDPEIDSIMDLLTGTGAILATGNHVFRLTQLGLHYDELKKLERTERWKERAYGFISGILLSVISGVFLKLLTG